MSIIRNVRPIFNVNALRLAHFTLVWQHWRCALRPAVRDCGLLLGWLCRAAAAKAIAATSELPEACSSADEALLVYIALYVRRMSVSFIQGILYLAHVFLLFSASYGIVGLVS